MVDFSYGLFLGKIPYTKSGTGPKKAVILPGSMDLILSIALNPAKAVKDKSSYFPPDYTYYVLGYDRNLPAGATLESIAGDYAEIIGKEMGTATIIGSSYGGLVALQLASQFSHLVEKVFLVSAACELSDTGMVFAKNLMTACETDNFHMMINELANLFTPKMYRGLVKLFGPLLKKWVNKRKNPGSTLVNAYKALLKPDFSLETLLPSIAAPTIVIGGTRDRVYSEAAYRKTASLVPNGTLHLFEGAGHLLETVKRKDFLGVLRHHLG
jgi:pimeloyl-ACP methyl ester carboxylesterase